MAKRFKIGQGGRVGVRFFFVQCILVV